MPIMYNTGDWFALRPGNVYRKFELYSLDWPLEINLEHMKVIGAPFSGPIAIVRDPDQIVPLKGTAKPIIRIINSAGMLISTIAWNHGKLLTMGWSNAEELICVQDDGNVYIYDMFGDEKQTFSMGKEVSHTKVLDARIFASSAGTGVAVMTTSFRVFLINNIKEPKNRQLPEIPKSVIKPECWEIVSEERNTYCLVGYERELLKLALGSVYDIKVPQIEKSYSSIAMISISYNHRYMALCTNTGIIWLGTTDMKTKFCEFDTRRSERPKQIEWILDSENCRQSDAVAITYPSLLLIVNTKGDQNMYTYDPAIFLIPEMDGVRVISNLSHEMLQKVPTAVQNIFAINSQEPSSFLFEAHKKFFERSHQADEYLGLLRDKIDVAVSECIEAASYEFDTETQKMLIRTAYFGKGFIASYVPDFYVKMCRVLRVLNALRHHKVGLPLTYKQFVELTPNVVLDRLVFRKHYAIAIQVAKYLKLAESRILEHWAIHKILYDKNDTEVARKITEKFKNPTVHGVSFCNIAAKAHEVGRDNLALKLLEQEPKRSLQVPLLLKLGKDENALSSATESGDTDLIFMVLLKLKETTQLAKFQMIIRRYAMAHNLYKKYCQMYSKTALQELYNMEDDYLSQAEFSLREAIDNSSLESSLPTIITLYTKAHKDVESSLCSEVRKVLGQQKVLSEKYKASETSQFYGMSINDTLKALLKIGDLKLAEKFKNEYKVPDRRFWWARIEILASQYRWEELDRFAKSKKSPVGYEPFVEVCLKHNNIPEAAKYIARCRDDKKVKWFIRAGLLDDAAATAFEQQDIHHLSTIQMIANRVDNNILVEKLSTYISQLSIRK